ncbi:MAG: phosphoglucomutase [Treponema sp.]|nr:phosphoglucomutase [Treponema sp.]
MNTNMILSASGWRKVFAVSNNEQDKTNLISEDDKALSVIAANVFFDYLSKLTNQKNPVIALGYDTRPTGPAIADAMIHALVKKGAILQFSGVTSAPEIMAYARKLDGFVYISASHNPVGHNGIKFGTNDGGVLNGTENAKLVEELKKQIADDSFVRNALETAYSASMESINTVYKTKDNAKFNALKAYKEFINETITDSSNKDHQKDFFDMLQFTLKENPIGVVCDFNGSSRSSCIDKEFFAENQINFFSINDKEIVHEIIPEAENLVHVAAEMERLQAAGHKEVKLGYMPDCDGDRGNIVYWDEKENKAVVLKAQEVFSLSVLAELTYSIWRHSGEPDFKPAVAVNCPTSMRIEELAAKLGAKVFRAEVGEANVVNLAREKRAEGYTVRILGEGSNGGTITYPSAVRDPLNTVFAIIKLLKMTDGTLYKIWCEKAGIEYKADFTLSDVLSTLPVYTTTGVSEARALLKINTTDHSVLKANFQKIFEKEWQKKSALLSKEYAIFNYEAVITNGTKETRNIDDYSKSGKGGLKIILKDKNNNPIAFMWMRGSGTEPVFRIMCDVKGHNPDFEIWLCDWLSQMLKEADK